jgi:flavin-dependent dehydrogenase
LKSDYDVIVIGGGPAGTTAATVLVQYGRNVVLFEKDIFPRYHVGESMIPYTYFPLKRIGLISKLHRQPFVKKNSVQFANIDGKDSQPFYFAEHMNHPAAQTWQAERNQFDQLLLENAKERGVTVIQGVKVDRILKSGDAVSGVGVVDNKKESFEYSAPMIIDATGRNGLSTKKFSWSVPDSLLQKVAIWNYFRGSKRDSGIDEGPEAIFQREITNNKWIEDHLAGSSSTDTYRITGDYSYRSKYCATDGIVLTGDAFAFLDPVFSSGLYFALKGGEMAADAVEHALRKDDVSASQFAYYGETFCHYIELMRRLVYVFYDKNFSFRPLLRKHPHLGVYVTDLLIGNLDKDFSELFRAMEAFVELPETLKHGRPLIKEMVEN